MSQKPEEKRNQRSAYIKYSGFGFQMVAVILLAYWGGSALDTKMGFKQPVFMLAFILLGIVGTIFLLIRSVILEQKERDRQNQDY